MAVSGLSYLAVALRIAGGWSTAIGLSHFLTTIIFTAAIVERPPIRMGPVCNRRGYRLMAFAVWPALLAGLMVAGII